MAMEAKKKKKLKVVTAAGAVVALAATFVVLLLSASPLEPILSWSNGYRLQTRNWWSEPSSQPLEWRPCRWWSQHSERTASAEKSNGFIIVECAGGLNQMRRDFCDGISVARLLNATLMLPRFHTSNYWNETSGFADIFDAEYFIQQMKGFLHVVKELPPYLASKPPVVVDCHKRKPFDYIETVLPVLLEHKLVIINPAASQRADRYPIWAKATRCQACFKAIRLVNHLESKAKLILDRIPRPFVALHLRFEPDMIAYSRCSYQNLSSSSLEAIEAVREGRPAFTGNLADNWRRRGKCPLTPVEAAFILQALRLPTNIPIYLASGGGLLEKDGFMKVYSNTYEKKDFLDTQLLKQLRGNSKAAIDYYVSLKSDLFIATYFGNMDKMVVADRSLINTGKTVVLNRKVFAEAISQGLNGSHLAYRVWQTHKALLDNGNLLPLPDCFCHSNAGQE
ncbi:hypothetical protein O6H91_11G007200 [Diphasiastrum complanatum]|uniref:Uncharacterized protein n=1 Tax=Diphasiastrum complanatum TaxID=34168 RepID=A0ACC2C682_DIPCM|nr:hypothetical protein O6H91_11G007200 [Diphasiastrum complanatum]